MRNKTPNQMHVQIKQLKEMLDQFATMQAENQKLKDYVVSLEKQCGRANLLLREAKRNEIEIRNKMRSLQEQLERRGRTIEDDLF